MVPVAGVTLLQAPPLAEFVSVDVWPTHTLSVPPIAPGRAFTVTVTVEEQLPAVKLIVAVPGLTPPIKPGLRILAIAGLLLVHTPGPPLASVVVKPTHRPSVPVIAGGPAFTVTMVVT